MGDLLERPESAKNVPKKFIEKGVEKEKNCIIDKCQATPNDGGNESTKKKPVVNNVFIIPLSCFKFIGTLFFFNYLR